MRKKIVVIIQARMGSSRLPGKVLMKIEGKTVLNHVVDRVGQAKLINDIVVATTEKDEDNPIVDECKRLGVNYYRGSEANVLERYYKAAKENKADIIVRVTSDCPLIDPIVLDEVLGFYLDNNYRIVTNAGNILKERTYPRGLDIEVTSYDSIEEAYINANKTYEREHVTPYIYETYPKEIYYYKNKEDYSNYRLTLDTIEDFKFIEILYKNLYFGRHDFYMDEIVRFLKNNPEIIKINENVVQKEVRGED